MDREPTMHINDLQHPVLTSAHRRAIEHWERDPVKLTEDAVVSAAREVSGLYDCGADDFSDRLRHWLRLVESDTSQTELGRARVFKRCVRYMVSRLRLTELLRRHPEISDVQIQKPIILIGPPRSGTTHLVNLLAADSRLRSLPLWESYEPIPASLSPEPPTRLDPRFIRCQKEWSELRSFVPHMAAMHPLNPEGIHEEVELQGPNFARWLWEWMGTGSCESNNQSGPDYLDQYEYMKTMLKALQWLRGPDRWVLKSVQHLNHLNHLISIFPDATLVMTHRDPVAMLASHMTMVAYLERLERYDVDTAAIGTYWIEQTDALLRSFMNYRELIPNCQIVNIMFHEFMDNELGAADQIYAAAGMEFHHQERIRLKNYLAGHPRGKHGRLAYDLIGDFDISPDQVWKRFSYYYKDYSVRRELG